MRPLRLELQGFSAFRDRTVVDFADVDLFAFVGATGAGKSSLIDAMVFALYGSVPRYEDKKLVHPAITQGAVEARVHLEFEVAGVVHSALRVVHRTKSGGTTKEARLERGSTVLAADAKAMTAAVVDLLGLDLDQFTKCVVLPQGAFAALLHDGKADRQKLLVKLLDLGLYNQIAGMARARASQAALRIESLADQLAASVGIGERIGAAAQRRDRLGDVIERIDAAAPDLAALAVEIADVDRELADHASLRRALAAIRTPSGLDELATAEAAAAGELAEADAAEDAAAAAVDAATVARDALGDRTEVQAVLQRWNDLDTVAGRVAKGETTVADQEAAIAPLAAAVANAAAGLEEATAELDAARVAHAAAAVVAQVSVGDDCPVCGAAIDTLVDHDDADLAAATSAHAAAVDTERAAHKALADAESKLAANRDLLTTLTADRDDLAATLDGAATPDELTAELAAIAAADAELTRARTAQDQARARVRAARVAAENADAALAESRRAYSAARDSVAAASPPSPTDDVVADWNDLVLWAATTDESVAASETAATQRRAAADERRRDVVDALVETASAAGVTVRDPERLRDACVADRATAEAEHDRLVAERAALEAVAERRDALVDERDVHELLARELGARNFEAWLLDEALEVLLDGASRWLDTLSSGRYALDVDDKHTFVVVDHANADERRLARTLSGGETFLASLSLALSLAEGIGDLSASGGRRLDAIFLDEGFGTLDADTLDVVATAIEELGASGRMVGVISHVPDLAERVPVRFVVSKGPTSSTVERQER